MAIRQRAARSLGRSLSRALALTTLLLILAGAAPGPIGIAQEATPDVTEPGDVPEQDALLIVVHAAPDAGPVDLYVDGALVLAGVAFGTPTDPPLGLVAGEHRFQVVPAGGAPEDAVIDETLGLDEGTTTLLSAVGPVAEIEAAVYEVDVSPVAPGQARLRVVQNATDAGPIDVAVAGGDVLVAGVGFPDASEYVEVEAGAYDVEVRGAGGDSVLLPLPGLEFAEGGVYELVAAGNLADNTFGVVVVSVLAGTPERVARPTHIHQGSCDNLDPNPLYPLNDVVLTGGEAQGNEAATRAETSFTNVPVDLATLLAADHAVNIHASQAEIDTYVACGEIGGVIEPTGALVVALREQSGSGLSGVAVLSPADGGATTDVSVFLTGEATGEAAAGGAANSATPIVERATPVP